VLIPFETSYLCDSEFSALFAIEGKYWSKWMWNEKWLCLYWKKNMGLRNYAKDYHLH